MGSAKEMRRLGPVGQRRAAAMRKLKPLLIARSGNRCEVPWCRVRGPLDPHHVVKRSAAGKDELGNIVLLCRKHHDQTDWPKGQQGHLEIRRLPTCFRFGVVFLEDFRLCMDGAHDACPLPTLPSSSVG